MYSVTLRCARCGCSGTKTCEEFTSHTRVIGMLMTYGWRQMDGEWLCLQCVRRDKESIYY